MSDEILLYRLSQAEGKITHAEAEIDTLKTTLAKVREEDAERERRNLKWGISTLGSAVLALGAVIWAYRGVIFK